MFLGHVISIKGININPKVKVVLNQNRPINMMKIHSLLSLSGIMIGSLKDLH